MTTRFEKAMQEAARATEDLGARRIVLENHAQKVRRLEELIRAKEATGDRIAVGIGAVLVVSSMALPVYAAFFSDGYVYLPNVGQSLATQGNFVAKTFQVMASSVSGTSDTKGAAMGRPEPEETSAIRMKATGAPLARYVIHNATEIAALIEGPSGLWWVKPGMTIPGAGQILAIERSEAGWAVVTSETTITEVSSGKAEN